jgi:hypothetical protein
MAQESPSRKDIRVGLVCIWYFNNILMFTDGISTLRAMFIVFFFCDAWYKLMILMRLH